MLTQWLQMTIEQYGYIVILLAVAIESMGIPFPGETALIAGAVYAGTGGNLSIVGVIAAAAAGAILGDNLGYFIGRTRGYQVVRNLAPKLHLNERHLAYAEGYFQRHGDKTVFVGRFFAILRCWAAFLAGVNRMHWRTFLFWNALGGITWAIIFGTLGYVLGNNLPLLERILRFIGWGGTIILVVIGLTLLICWLLWRRGILRAAWLDALWGRLGRWLVHPDALAAQRDDPPDAAQTSPPATGEDRQVEQRTEPTGAEPSDMDGQAAKPVQAAEREAAAGPGAESEPPKPPRQ
jgi:membrane protein DedA with SNARE-associated domain